MDSQEWETTCEEIRMALTCLDATHKVYWRDSTAHSGYKTVVIRYDALPHFEAQQIAFIETWGRCIASTDDIPATRDFKWAVQVIVKGQFLTEHFTEIDLVEIILHMGWTRTPDGEQRLFEIQTELPSGIIEHKNAPAKCEDWGFRSSKDGSRCVDAPTLHKLESNAHNPDAQMKAAFVRRWAGSPPIPNTDIAASAQIEAKAAETIGAMKRSERPKSRAGSPLKTEGWEVAAFAAELMLLRDDADVTNEAIFDALPAGTVGTKDVVKRVRDRQHKRAKLAAKDFAGAHLRSTGLAVGEQGVDMQQRAELIAKKHYWRAWLEGGYKGDWAYLEVILKRELAQQRM